MTHRYTCRQLLTHWGWVTHKFVSNLTIIGSDNGLSPGWRQAITWTNAGLLLIWPLGTNFSEMLFRIQTFSFKKMHFKMSSAKWRPFCLGLNELNDGWAEYEIECNQARGRYHGTLVALSPCNIRCITIFYEVALTMGIEMFELMS